MTGKDLLAVIRELSIQARASNSVLADEEIFRIREHLQEKADAAASEKREGTNIIVRRRRKPEAKKTAKADEEPEVAADVTEATATVPQAKTAEKAPADTVTVKKDVDSAIADDQAPAAVEKAAKKTARKSEKPVTSGARIVSLPQTAQVKAPQPAEKPSAETAQPVKENHAPAEAKAPVKADDKRAAAPNLSVEPEKNADGTPLSSAPTPAVVKPEGRHDVDAESDDSSDTEELERSVGVKIISRPSPAQVRANAERQERSARPGSGRTDNRSSGNRPSYNQPRQQGGGFVMPGMEQPAAEGEGRNKKRQKGKRTVDFSGGSRKGGEGEEGWMRPTRRNKGRKGKDLKASSSQPLKAAKRKIRMEEFIRVADLAHQMGLKAGEIIKVLFNLGVMATINQSLDVDTATLVASEFDYEVENVGFSEQDIIASSHEHDADPEKMVTRPPVVTIMGHVDHGKTSLLDAIRKTSVTSGEAGGITQHIGAYHVHSKKGDIVFLDTPGHEAFTAMRARGAEVTDIVVLVVAADDGVKEQTREAVNHAKAAGVPIMVAVNKMDKEGADPDRVKRELSELGLLAEDWGGDIPFSYVSAKTRQGLDDFLELLALQADILELKANPDTAARGHIVEAKLDKGRGSLGTVLIQQGTLHVGDAFVCGVYHGRVRAMFDDQGQKVEEAGPSMPVEVQGFEGVPEAGEEFICLADEKNARRIAEARALKQRERELAKESKVTLETFLSRRADEESHVLNLVVKADVQGSLEAILDQLKKLSTDKVRISVVHGGAGAISESDVLLAAASDAIIIGFNVRPNPKTKELADQEKVDIRFYDIIYKLVEEIHSAMEGLLAPVEKEVALGTAEVRETFSVPKAGTIAGCQVTDGKIVRNAHVRLLRDGVVVYTGIIGSLKRFKDDAKEVLKGYECGIGIENYNDIKQGDVIEAFEIIEEAATL